jgi:CheY-like chemotaxis protein
MEAIGQLAGGVAHDFNNLLTVITGRVHLLLQRANARSGEPDRRDAELIADTAERAAMLTRQLLVFSRKEVLRPTILDVTGIVARIVPLLRRLIGEDIELITQAEPGSSLVKADANQIEQVILNLAVNARDAMPQGGRLTIETATIRGHAAGDQLVEIDPGRDYVVLRVTDTGHGMDAATRAQLFEPFFTTKEPGRGTGLGLAVVLGIVRQHEGVVQVESEPGRGSTFAVYLPKTIESGATPASGPPSGSTPRPGNETILLAEDDGQVRVLIRDILAMNGYKVLAAGHGPDALQILGQHPARIDLVVTDVVMLGISGPELVRRVMSVRPDIKVLYLSGYTADVLGRHAAIEPNLMLLEKPFTPEALLRAVRHALEVGQRSDGPGGGDSEDHEGKIAKRDSTATAQG